MAVTAAQIAQIAATLQACDTDTYVDKEVAAAPGQLDDGTQYEAGDTLLIMTDGTRVCIPQKSDDDDYIYQTGELAPFTVTCSDGTVINVGDVIPADVTIIFDGDEAICLTQVDTPYVPLKELFKPDDTLPANMLGTITGQLDDGYWDDDTYVNGTPVQLGATDVIPADFVGCIQVDEADGSAVCIPTKPPLLDLQTRLNEAQGHKCSHVYGYDVEIITAPLTSPEGVVLHGGCLQINATMNTAITLEDCAGLENVCIQCNSNVTNRAVFSIATEGAFVRESEFTGENNADVIWFQDTTNSEIIENEFTEGWNPIVVTGDTNKIRVESNELAGWRQRAIFVTTDTGTKDVSILENCIRPHRAEAPSPKQPIAVQGTGNGFHVGIKINRNDVEGLRNHNTGASQTDPNGNTADQISLHFGQEFEINDNTSAWGGELGINVSRGSTHGTIHGNHVHHNDLAGISVGAGGNGVNERCSWISVMCNTTYNNGQIIDQDVQALNSAGLWADNSDNLFFKGNSSFDTGLGWQQYGLRVRNSTGIEGTGINDNCYKGNGVTEVFIN